MPDIVEELREYLSPVFCGTSLDQLTDGAIVWRTIQNKRADRNLPLEEKPPEEAFVRSGTKILVRRDIFLDWWATTLTDARTGEPLTPDDATGKRRKAA